MQNVGMLVIKYYTCNPHWRKGALPSQDPKLECVCCGSYVPSLPPLLFSFFQSCTCPWRQNNAICDAKNNFRRIKLLYFYRTILFNNCNDLSNICFLSNHLSEPRIGWFGGSSSCCVAPPVLPLPPPTHTHERLVWSSSALFPSQCGLPIHVLTHLPPFSYLPADRPVPSQTTADSKPTVLSLW